MPSYHSQSLLRCNGRYGHNFCSINGSITWFSLRTSMQICSFCKEYIRNHAPAPSWSRSKAPLPCRSLVSTSLLVFHYKHTDQRSSASVYFESSASTYFRDAYYPLSRSLFQPSFEIRATIYQPWAHLLSILHYSPAQRNSSFLSRHKPVSTKLFLQFS